MGESTHTGRITNITDYGAFVELEDGVEGLIHVSEMSWTKKNVHPGKIVSTSQEVDVMVLDVDSDKRRISLGLKQCMDNPWDAFIAEHPVGSELKAKSVASPNSVCSSVSVLNSTAWFTSTTSTGTVRAKKPSKTITKATPSKLRSSKSTLRKNVSLSASNSLAT